MNILIVEDEPKTGDYLRQGLREAGHITDLARDGADGLHAALHGAHDLLILDVALPSCDGWEILHALRARGRGVPVLFLTARDHVDDRVRGLELGADDYLVKPFFPAELEARITALIRRRRAEVAPALLQVGDVVLDPRAQRVTRDGQEIDLTPTGMRILQILMRESPKVVTRSQLEQELWGLESPDSDALRSHLYVLRKAIDRGRATRLVHTLPNVGYRVLPLSADDLDEARSRRARERRGRGSRNAADAGRAAATMSALTV